MEKTNEEILREMKARLRVFGEYTLSQARERSRMGFMPDLSLVEIQMIEASIKNEGKMGELGLTSEGLRKLHNRCAVILAQNSFIQSRLGNEGDPQSRRIETDKVLAKIGWTRADLADSLRNEVKAIFERDNFDGLSAVEIMISLMRDAYDLELGHAAIAKLINFAKECAENPPALRPFKPIDYMMKALEFARASIGDIGLTQEQADQRQI